MVSTTTNRAQNKSRKRKKARSEIKQQRKRLEEEKGEEFTSLPEKDQEAMARKACLERGGVQTRDGMRALLQKERSNLQDEIEELKKSYMRLNSGKTNAEDAEVLAGVDVKGIIRSDRTDEEKAEAIWNAFDDVEEADRQAAIQSVRGRQDVLAGNLAPNMIGSDINTVSAMVKGMFSSDAESFFEATLDEIGEDLSSRHAEVLAEEILQKLYNNLDNPEEHFAEKVEEMDELNEVVEDLLFGRNVDEVNGFESAIDFQEEIKATVRDQRSGTEQKN